MLQTGLKPVDMNWCVCKKPEVQTMFQRKYLSAKGFEARDMTVHIQKHIPTKFCNYNKNFEIRVIKIAAKEHLRRPGVEPGSTAWKAAMLTVIPPTLTSI
ncbi:hypothetical protein AVEN_33794-1 [Araneus ventricosus]|uniref:Uncharacterized protein n=1 Tax=Araneus ventricosus TaxID=182803 RepID=A0A4Y2BF87_ARAVE|nr:hypothetical protein AVEN_33794-1 [Araneus ventricosus]